MRNLLLGVVLALAFNAYAFEWQKDGGLLLSREEAEETEKNFYVLSSNFKLATQQVYELRRQLEEVKNNKCL
jgi:hypothetical protein